MYAYEQHKCNSLPRFNNWLECRLPPIASQVFKLVLDFRWTAFGETQGSTPPWMHWCFEMLDCVDMKTPTHSINFYWDGVHSTRDMRDALVPF